MKLSKKVIDCTKLDSFGVILMLNDLPKTRSAAFKVSHEVANSKYFKDNFPLQTEGFIENNLFPFGETNLVTGVVTYEIRKADAKEKVVNDIESHKKRVLDKKSKRVRKERIAKGEGYKVND